jgi:nucleoid-associated protein YgaU
MRTPPLRVVGIACLLGLAVPPCFGQDLAELARQERARRQSQSAGPEHVYTNTDMVRPQILLPEDRARFAIPRTEPTVAADAVATQVSPAPSNTSEIPLGDFARYYRQVKQMREAQAQGTLPELGVETVLAKPAAPLLAPKVESASEEARVAPHVAPPVGPLPAPPGNDAPLGDVARYYQWLKAFRETQSEGNKAPESPASLVTSTLPGAGSAPLASPGDHPLAPEIRRSPHGLELQLPRRVRVASGDSLWKLAQHYLGRGTKWRTLAALNPQVVDPRRLQVGDWIRLPDLSSPLGVRFQPRSGALSQPRLKPRVGSSGLSLPGPARTHQGYQLLPRTRLHGSPPA